MYRRNLPHWHAPRAAVFVTWRLAGTLPIFKTRKEDGRAFMAGDRLLDSATKGPRWLEMSDIAEQVIAELRDGDGNRYELHSFVAMPNHVHLLVSPWHELAIVTRLIKGKSARRANLLLNRTGQPFWQDESFDHWIRHPRQFESVRSYIENNPVTAGLAERPELWPYSSAFRATG
ncbi:MAG TPA: transposase [Bryobacteraceae bacterium]|nr:transposase [Bryobacteraceae bacterium]